MKSRRPNKLSPKYRLSQRSKNAAPSSRHNCTRDGSMLKTGFICATVKSTRLVSKLTYK